MQEILRVFAAVLVLICLALPGLSEPAQIRPHSALGSALDAAKAGRWTRAATLAAREGAAAEAIIEWSRLRAGRGTVAEIDAFLAAHPDWPGLDYLRKQSEPVFETASDAQVIAFYGQSAPQTAAGV